MKVSVFETHQRDGLLDGPGGFHDSNREGLFNEYGTIYNMHREPKTLEETIKPMISKNDHQVKT